MKKLIMTLAITGLSALLAECRAAIMLAEGTYLDSMTDTSLWSAYKAGQTPVFLPPTDPGVWAVDPRVHDADGFHHGGLDIATTDGFWLEYRTAPGQFFSYVDLCWLAAGNDPIAQLKGWVGLSYSTDGLTFTDIAPKAPTEYYRITSGGEYGGNWPTYLQDYDFSARGLSPVAIRVSKSSLTENTNTTTYSPRVSSVYLEVVPEPASLALLGLGALTLLRRRRA